MTEQVLDVRGVLRAIARRRVLVVVLLLAGIGAGLLVSVLQPPTFVARSRVLLPRSPGTDATGRPLRDVTTETFIARSSDVLAAAARALGRPVAPAELRRRVSVRAVSGDLLEVRAQARSSGDARVLADAVATAYVEYANSASAGEAETAIAELQEQAGELDARVREIEARIATITASIAGQDPSSPEAASGAALVASLRSEQVDTEGRLYNLNNRIGEARLEAQLSRRGTRVIERATAPGGPARPRGPWNMGVGGLVGLLAGLVLALAVEQRDRRLYRRDDVAESVLAPVLASLAVPSRGGVKGCGALLERWEPSPTEHLALKEAFAHLGISEETGPVDLVVVTLPGDRVAPLLAGQLAVFAALAGTPTAFVVATTHPSSAELQVVCHDWARRSSPVRPNLAVFRVCDVEKDDLESAELTVAVAVAAEEVEPLLSTTSSRWTSVVLAVSAGTATADTLASSTAAWLGAGYPLRGVFLANPDPTDRSVGRGRLPLPEATAPRPRAVARVADEAAALTSRSVRSTRSEGVERSYGRTDVEGEPRTWPEAVGDDVGAARHLER